MPTMFKKATKDAARIRLGIDGPSGSGKTWTGLLIGAYLAKQTGGRLAVIDTENGSASKYSDEYDFDTVPLTDFHPQHYVDAIHDAEDNGFAALLIDSLSHAWTGKGGVLELHDKASIKDKSNNKYVAWRDVTPVHNKLVEALVQCKVHLIVTLRTKTEYVQEKDSEGKTKIRRVGLAPIQRDGLEYEFDVFGSLDVENTLIIAKTRCPVLNGQVIDKPDDKLAKTLFDWVSSGRSAEDRLKQARAEYAKVFDQAKEVGIESAKPAPEDATAPQLERWAVLLQKRVNDLAQVKSQPVD